MPIAKVDGLYRCSGDGQTWFRRKGEALEPCNCGGGNWELLATDNAKPEEMLLVIIGDGKMQAIFTAQLPEVDVVLNLRGGYSKYDGAYLITEVSITSYDGDEVFRIEVMRIGDKSAKLPIHNVILIGV